ncbi:hypothetical protein V5799_026617 [Amblyomma americanum]|uniref:Uncharacterized protein n=1 Tax=Amblyomma americanum TaxID=6943 RepID=A0AAQ4DI27_AMBAM
MGKGGHFLTSYYRTCVETLRHTEVFLRSLASAIARRSWKSMEALNTKTALVFIFTASVNPDKDAQARTLFTTVKRVVHADCQSSRLFDAHDSERLQSFFNNLVLVTPIEASQISVTVPNTTIEFGEGLLRARLHDFDVAKLCEETLTNTQGTEYHDILFLGDKQLLVSSSVYEFNNASSGNHELANKALLGRLLAESLWYMALTGIQWSAETRTHIDRFKT